MTGNCGKITAGISIDCDNPLVGGVKDRLILINQDDLVGDWDRNITNPQIIEGAHLVTSPVAKAYAFEGKNSSIDATDAFVKGTYSEGYTHTLVFRAFGNSADIKKQVEALGKGKFYAIVENNFKGANGAAAFEVYGTDIGLEKTVQERNKSDADTQGAYVITLSTNEKFKEPHLPATFYKTSYSATKAIIDALL